MGRRGYDVIAGCLMLFNCLSVAYVNSASYRVLMLLKKILFPGINEGVTVVGAAHLFYTC